MEGFLEITGIDIRKLVAAAYEESAPVGLGALHFQPGPLPKSELERIVGHMKIQGQGNCLTLDYVLGRAVKLSIFRDNENRLWVRKDWYDHTELQLFRVLKKAGWVM